LASVFLTVSVGMAASLEAKRQTKMSHVVTASDETKKTNSLKRICFGLFWFKICSRGEKT
jgi:hypothetical protein